MTQIKRINFRQSTREWHFHFEDGAVHKTTDRAAAARLAEAAFPGGPPRNRYGASIVGPDVGCE